MFLVRKKPAGRGFFLCTSFSYDFRNARLAMNVIATQKAKVTTTSKAILGTRPPITGLKAVTASGGISAKVKTILRIRSTVYDRGLILVRMSSHNGKLRSGKKAPESIVIGKVIN